jgi:hypothetical protein
VDENERSKLLKLIKLSLVPKMPEGIKFQIIDVPKDCKLELRSLPPIELYILLPESYPSNSGPLFMIPNTQNSNILFYDQLRNFLYERLIEKWSDEMIVLYECVYYIQDELFPAFIDSDAFSQKGSRFHRNSLGHIEVKYNSSNEFQKVFDDSVSAQRRSFNMEEHQCKICMRKLLGDKFFFLSGCEHYFCLECIVEMVTLSFKNGQIGNICCAEASCKKQLNDIDIKNIGLDEEYVEKYEKFSLHNAIAQMDDLGWCPLPGCGSLATIERDQNLGKCQHCDFTFCLACRERYHPFKRCLINRLDLFQELVSAQQIEDIEARNKKSETLLNTLYLKHCAKPCPKCG